MGINRFCVILVVLIFAACFIIKTSENEGPDTSLFDFVSYGVFEDFVDLLEYTAWTGRRVKEHIDELLETSFVLFSKQQDMMHSVIKMAEEKNRKDCTDSVFMNVTDVVFQEYFNMNINCPLIGQRMSIFFNEIHNITSRIADIHRRYINRAAECGPPMRPQPDRECLQSLVEGCRSETEDLRDFMFMLSRDVDEFMDGQEEEAFICSMKGMSLVRNAAKKGVDDITQCLNVNNDYNKKYDSPMVRASMGLVSYPFERIRKQLDNETRTAVNEPLPLQFVPPKQPYYQPNPPYQPHQAPPPEMHPHMYQHPPGAHPQMHPGMYQGQPGMPQPNMHPPGMYPPHHQMHPQNPQMYPPQPHMHPYQPQMHPNYPQMHPLHQQKPVPGAQPQNEPTFQPRPKDDSKPPPPWKIDPKKIPKYAYDDNIIRDGSFEFDPDLLNELNDEELEYEEPKHDHVNDEL